MNATQIKYARERARQIFEQRKRAIKDLHTTPEVKLSHTAKLKALASGAFDVKAPRTTEYCLSAFVAFHGEVECTVDQKAVDKETKALTKTYDALVDQLVLGDAEDALRMLKDFEGGR